MPQQLPLCDCLVPDCSPLRSASQKPKFSLTMPCLGPNGRGQKKKGEKEKGLALALKGQLQGAEFCEFPLLPLLLLSRLWPPQHYWGTGVQVNGEKK